MTYVYRVLKDNPIGVWPLDSDYSDASGYGNNATAAGTINADRPIVAQGIGAKVLTTGSSITLPISSVFTTAKSKSPFSYGIWFKSRTASGTAWLMNRDGAGLKVVDNTLVFTVTMSAAITVTYIGLKPGNDYQAWVVYDTQSIYLYVNGVMVANEAISSADYNAGFSSLTSSSLLIEPSGTYTLVVDTPEIYNYALSTDAIQAHYAMGTKYADMFTISTRNGGIPLTLDDSGTSIKAKWVMDNDMDWNAGQIANLVAVRSGTLASQYDSTLSTYGSGTWTRTFLLEPETGATVNSSRITWDANASIQVDVSINDAAFTTVTNGSAPVDYQALDNGLSVTVRVTVSAAADQTVVSKLNLTLYKSKNLASTNGTITGIVNTPSTTTVAEYAYPAASFNDNAGLVLQNGLQINNDAAFNGFQGLEMLVRIDAATVSKTILVAGAASITSDASGNWVWTGLTALYVNGSAVTSPYTPLVGSTLHIIAVFPSTTQLLIGNNSGLTSAYPMKIGYLSTYDFAFTAGQVTSIYSAWVGAAAARISETQNATIQESAFAETGVSYRGYAYNWSITGAG